MQNVVSYSRITLQYVSGNIFQFSEKGTLEGRGVHPSTPSSFTHGFQRGAWWEFPHLDLADFRLRPSKNQTNLYNFQAVDDLPNHDVELMESSALADREKKRVVQLKQ